jgi:hypothetical protein
LQDLGPVAQTARKYLFPREKKFYFQAPDRGSPTAEPMAMIHRQIFPGLGADRAFAAWRILGLGRANSKPGTAMRHDRRGVTEILDLERKPRAVLP